MEISLVIPAYNEEANLEPLLKSLLSFLKRENLNCEIIVVDDASSDDTGKIADRWAREYRNISVLHRKKGKNGMGAALKEGTKKARGELVLWLMGDRSDDLDTIPRMIKKIKEGYGMIFASRYMRGGSRGNLSRLKAFLSSRFTVIVRWFFSIPTHDITNAFRIFKKSLFDSIYLESDDFAISPELAIKTHLLGFRMGEVPTTYAVRQADKTKFKIGKMVIRYLSLLKYRFIPRERFQIVDPEERR